MVSRAEPFWAVLGRAQPFWAVLGRAEPFWAEQLFQVGNVLSLHRIGAFARLGEQLAKYKIGVVALQEVRWKGNDIMDSGNRTIFYSGQDAQEIGTGFVVAKHSRHMVSKFTPVNERLRLCVLRMRGKMFIVSLICTHAPIEEAEEEIKDKFYEQLENIYDNLPKYDVKILLGDMNAKRRGPQTNYWAI
jgi:exonuclease III